MSDWVTVRGGALRCVRHGVEFRAGLSCAQCETDPSEPEPEDIGPLPYLSGLPTAIEHEAWCVAQATYYLDWAKSADTETGIVKGGDLAFKFRKLAMQSADRREAQYTAERQIRERERIENMRPADAIVDAIDTTAEAE